MAYGFNLGQIEGLDSTVRKIECSIVVDEHTAFYIGMRYSGNETWKGTETQLYNTPDGYCLIITDLTASDVGKTAAITLHSDGDVPTSDFKSAVKKSIEPIIIYMPRFVFTTIQSVLGQHINNVISNAGKICAVPDISIGYLEYADAEEQAQFKSFSIAVANAATLSQETSVYIDNILVTERTEVSNGSSTIGGSIVYSQNITTGGMKFKVFIKITGLYSGETVSIYIDAVYPVVLS